MAKIQFSRGLDEEVIPDVRLTRLRNGGQGTAKFIFENPKILDQGTTEDITGMYLIDEEGEIVTREVKAKFINGKTGRIRSSLHNEICRGMGSVYTLHGTIWRRKRSRIHQNW